MSYSNLYWITTMGQVPNVLISHKNNFANNMVIISDQCKSPWLYILIDFGCFFFREILGSQKNLAESTEYPSTYYPRTHPCYFQVIQVKLLDWKKCKFLGLGKAKNVKILPIKSSSSLIFVIYFYKFEISHTNKVKLFKFYLNECLNTLKFRLWNSISNQ